MHRQVHASQGAHFDFAAEQVTLLDLFEPDDGTGSLHSQARRTLFRRIICGRSAAGNFAIELVTHCCSLVVIQLAVTILIELLEQTELIRGASDYVLDEGDTSLHGKSRVALGLTYLATASFISGHFSAGPTPPGRCPNAGLRFSLRLASR